MDNKRLPMRHSCAARGQDNRQARAWAGVFFLLIGGLLLARASGAPLPTWLFTGPVLIMVISFYVGIRHRFRNFFWLLPFSVGALLLADRLTPSINLRPYLWPVIFIGAGLFFIMRSRSSSPFRRRWDDGNNPSNPNSPSPSEPVDSYTNGAVDTSDNLDLTAVFGGVKKNIISKNFRGGETVTFMGGTEVNLTQADFKDRVVIDTFNMFGGTKLIIPPDWELQSSIVAIFGGVDDKRPPVATSSGKVLYLDGTCIFGGVEIKSY